LTHNIALLQVSNLTVTFNVQKSSVSAVDNVSFALNKGQSLGILGESGSGKTQIAHGIMGLLPSNSTASGSILFKNKQLLKVSEKQFNQLRPRHLSIVFQDAMSALNPYLTIGTQLSEVLMHHEGMSQSDAITASINMLDNVRIPDAKVRIKCYPHQLSGGMRQRVLIAMALLLKPDLLIADEPTTALDMTVQAEIITLLKALKDELDMSLILISHDFRVMARLCDSLLVIKSGQVIEAGSIQRVFANPEQVYTARLMTLQD